jgi:hypothetical protein
MAPPFRFPGRDLLSRDAYGHSTIGAGGLNCRVRDGNGCYTSAMTTGNLQTREPRACRPEQRDGPTRSAPIFS